MPKFVYDLVDKIALQATMQGGYVPKQEIVKMLATASTDLFNTYYGKPSGLRNGRQTPAIAYQVSTQVADALQPFLREQRYSGSGPALAGDQILYGDGHFFAPSDMIHPTSFETSDGLAPVDVLDDMQRVYGLNDPIAGPTKDFPKAIVRPGGKYVVYPAPTVVTLTYIALPPIPTYREVYDLNGIATYDDVNSVDVGWGRQHEPELIERTLRLLAQATRDGQLTQTAGALTQDNI